MEVCALARGIPWRRRHIADCPIGDMIFRIGKHPDNPVIARRAIFPGRADNQSLDVLVNSWSAGTSPRLRSVEFASNEPSVPREDGVGLGGRRPFAQCPTA